MTNCYGYLGPLEANHRYFEYGSSPEEKPPSFHFFAAFALMLSVSKSWVQLSMIAGSYSVFDSFCDLLNFTLGTPTYAWCY